MLTTNSAGLVMAWGEGGTVWVKVNNKVPVAPGKGQMPSVAGSGSTAICVWEAQGQVMMVTIAP
ncbi:MAG: hypothetical protein H7Z72_10945 [Bacteroidetes bacterium]|nr:hypothetical protein [Fibrella sp.]